MAKSSNSKPAKRAPGWREVPADALQVRDGFVLADVDPGATPGWPGDKESGQKALLHYSATLAEQQELLFANGKEGSPKSVLLVLQAMDTAGKGGAVSHVVGQVDPQGVRITGFKAPTAEERAHDFLWRIKKALPQPGYIGVFDRSHYEDVLIHRVRKLTPLDEIEKRYGIINDFEKDLVDSGTSIVKVMLHISKAEQKKRLADRLDDPTKYWKYSPGDIDERELWDDYMTAYQIALTRTSSAEAPWYVVPADNKWYARLAVQSLLTQALLDCKLDWPPASFDLSTEKKRVAAS